MKGKAKTKGRTFTTELDVVGLNHHMTHSARRALAGVLDKGAITGLRFEREPDNKFDSNAIKVMLPERLLNGKWIGYFRANHAEILAPRIDAGSLELVTGEIIHLSPDNDYGDGTMLVKFRDKN